MRRRELLAGLAAIAVAGHIARARGAGLRRIGFLTPVGFAPGSTAGRLVDAVVHALVGQGLVEGTDFAIVKRGAAAHYERLAALMAELLAEHVDVVVATSYPAALAAKQATQSVPIVTVNTGDPVKTGLVASLGRPGGNITGISDVAAELAPKRLEFLKELVPSLRRVAMLWNASDLGMSLRYEATAAVATQLGITVQSLGVREPDDFKDAFAVMEQSRPDGILMVSDTLMILNRKRVFDFAGAHRIAAIYEDGRYAHDGGLMSYGPDASETATRAASLVARVLNGTQPGELPVEQPTKFELVINVKTAKALGLAVPPSLLARADEVIE
ncbi:MAG TPA: ABC transporter substrate-binding protein [Stellaceae bacterium]|nr:ABC transporter substrate-binding protein [Stellaceae bacterium]